MARIYTKTGDKGETGLFDGSRVAKDDLRVETYGTVDELNSVLSLARIRSEDAALRDAVREIQRFLFTLGADLATPPGGKGAERVQRVTADDVQGLEALIDAYWARIDPLDQFVVPGETETGASFHVARTVCRRAERLAVRLARETEVSSELVRYLNRLSDLLFTWGRFADQGHAPDTVGGLRSR